MKGTINYVDGVTVSLLISMKEQAYHYTINVVDCPSAIFIETSKFTATPST
jgi:hypothetical protein